MVYIPPRGSFVDHNLLKPQCLRSILQHVSPLAVGRYAVTAYYKRYPSKIKNKIKIIEIYFKKEVIFKCLKV